jgi:glycosyltransferase involved in cell wall biosynthesis
LRQRFPDRGDRIHRIYNGLDLAPFVRADFSSIPPLIVAVGRLIAKKGFADLIRACRLLMERGKSFRCEIIGEGPLEAELREQIAQLDLQDCVELLGAKPQHEIRECLATASAFVLPSVVDPDGGMDNLPTVIMEAMAAGLPIISTATGGIPEMVIQNETGFLVPPGDVAALAGAIERLFDDIGLAQRLGECGFQRAKELFSIDKNVRSLLALIDPDNNYPSNS